MITREQRYPQRQRRFHIHEKSRDLNEVLGEIHIAAERSPNDYHSGQAFAKPGTVPDPIAVHAFAYMLERMNPNNIDGHMFLGAYELEKEVIAQTARLLGKTDEESMTDGFMLSGGTESLNQALWMLRNRYYRENAGVDVDAVGLAVADTTLRERTGKRSPVILMPIDAHFTAASKAPALLGLGRDAIRFVPLSPEYAMDPAVVQREAEAIRAEGRDVFAYISVFGDTQKGRLEDVAAVSEALARGSSGAPPSIIVDAAAQYLFAAAMQDSPRHGSIPTWDFRVPGVEAIIADPHKNQIPYSCGLLLLKDQSLARETHVEAAYLSRDLHANLSGISDHEREDAQINATIPTSRPGYAAAALWAYYQFYGLENIRARKEGIWRLTQDLATELHSSPHYELVMRPQSSVVSFRTTDHDAERMSRIYAAINTSPHDNLYISKSTTTAARTLDDLRVAREQGAASPYTALHVHVMEHNKPASVEVLLRRLDEEARRSA